MPPDMPDGSLPHQPSDLSFAADTEQSLSEPIDEGPGLEYDETDAGRAHARNVADQSHDGETLAVPDAQTDNRSDAAGPGRSGRRQLRRRAARGSREERRRSVRQRWLHARRLRLRRARVRARRRRYGTSRPGPVHRGAALAGGARPMGTRRGRSADRAETARPTNRAARADPPGHDSRCGCGSCNNELSNEVWAVPSGEPAAGMTRHETARTREQTDSWSDPGHRRQRGQRRQLGQLNPGQRFPWQRLAAAVVVIVILELALLGALVLWLAILCSTTHCRLSASPEITSDRRTVQLTAQVTGQVPDLTRSSTSVSEPAHHGSPLTARPVTGSQGVAWSSPAPVTPAAADSGWPGTTVRAGRTPVIPVQALDRDLLGGEPALRAVTRKVIRPVIGSVIQEGPGSGVSAGRMTRLHPHDDLPGSSDSSVHGSAARITGLTGLTLSVGAPAVASATMIRTAASVSGRPFTYLTPPPQASSGTADLPTVISNATNWLRGICAGLATMFATLAGVRWVSAREPSDVDRAKAALAASGTGFALALLAPQIVTILRGILGASNG